MKEKKLHKEIKWFLSVKITLIFSSNYCFLTLVTCITTLTFPIYIRSISVLMFSINLGFLTITMRPERRQTIVIMSLCWNYRVTFKSNACNQLKISLHPQIEWIATGFCSLYTHLTRTLKITASVFTCVKSRVCAVHDNYLRWL